MFLCREKPENPRTVTLPGFHYVDQRSDITNNDRNYSCNVEQQEISKARLSPLACFTSRMSTIVGCGANYCNVFIEIEKIKLHLTIYTLRCCD